MAPQEEHDRSLPRMTRSFSLGLNAHATPTVTRFGWSYAPGDKVIQTINDYDKDTFNGDIGQAMRVDLEEGEVVISFDGRDVLYDVAELDEVALAYATTV